MVAKQLHIFAREVVLSGMYCQKAKDGHIKCGL